MSIGSRIASPTWLTATTGLKWNEVAKSKAALMLVQRRWLDLDLRTLEEKYRVVGLNDKDTGIAFDLVRKVQPSNRLVLPRRYRGFRWRTEPELPSNSPRRRERKVFRLAHQEVARPVT